MNSSFKETSILIHCHADKFFNEENRNLDFCKKYCAFQHIVACEYIIHIPVYNMDFHEFVTKMKNFGCTDEFIDSYKDAKLFGARYVCYYV